jgi:hypothetical protein
MELVRRSTLSATQLNSEDFRITDSGYGRTAALYRCAKCHFRQAADLPDVLRFYERLEDAEYVGTWKSRAKQARQLLERLIHFGGSGRLLDIGAGSGILVEAALQLGFAAEGVEPSAWLQAQSATRRLPVHHGTLPHSEIHGPYDTATIIDVLVGGTTALLMLVISIGIPSKRHSGEVDWSLLRGSAPAGTSLPITWQFAYSHIFPRFCARRSRQYCSDLLYD